MAKTVVHICQDFKRLRILVEQLRARYLIAESILGWLDEVCNLMKAILLQFLFKKEELLGVQALVVKTRGKFLLLLVDSLELICYWYEIDD